MGQLVWIASYPKSGNTWVRAFLHNYIRQPAAPYDINCLTDLTASDVNAERYARYDPRPASQYSVADVQRMRPLVQHDLMALDPSLVFVKTHNARLTVAGTPLIVPEVTAGAICIVRDPRDVAVSYSRHRGRSIDDTIAFMADPRAATGGTDAKVHEWLGTWSVHVNSWTARRDPRVFVLRYESLVAAPAEAFGRLIGWLGQDPPAGRLERAIRFSAFAELHAQERARGFKERVAEATGPFFGAGQPGGWRDVLSPAQAARIEQDHAAAMRRFGYL
ncbi:MAG TPA: sulfotransferase domain-containing protein [Acetobacteraceae bacterium]|nr:sulfotransferase domain-containing protein [Acetobacteraceae bacterium]